MNTLEQRMDLNHNGKLDVWEKVILGAGIAAVLALSAALGGAAVSVIVRACHG